MPRLRRIVFYLLTAAYLIVCPLTILYAFGVVLQPGAARGMVWTGLLSVSSVPSGASVYLNNRRYTERTPTVIRGLLPGSYHIKLVHRGHQFWTHTVDIKAGRAATLDHILLVPLRPTGKELLPDSFEDLLPLGPDGSILLIRGDRLEELEVYDPHDAVSTPLCVPDSPWYGARVLSLVHTEESGHVVVRVRARDGEHFLWVTPRSGASRIDDLTNLVMAKPARIAWAPEHDGIVFTVHEGSLNRLDRLDLTVYPNILEQVRGLGFSKRACYALTADGLLRRMNLPGSAWDVLPDEMLPPPAFLETRGFVELTVLHDNLVLFVGEDGALISNRPSYQLVERGVRGMTVRPQEDRVLVWQRDRVGVLDLSSAAANAHDTNEGLHIQWLMTNGESIEQALWINHGSAIIVRDKNTVSVLQAWSTGVPHRTPWLEVKRHSAVTWSEDSGTLYYLDRSTGHFSSLALRPSWEPFFLPFSARRPAARRDRIPAP